jgi:hypothetical protein
MARPGTVNDSVENAPAGLWPQPNGVDMYNVEYDGSFWLLQAKHLTNSADFVPQVLPRLLLGMSGLVVGLVASYREFP